MKMAMSVRPAQVGVVVLAVLTLAVLSGCGTIGGDGEDSPTTGAPAQQWTPGDGAATETSPPTSDLPDVRATPPTPQSTLPADAAGVNRDDPVAVATTATRIWFTWDTGRDRSPSDAVARAAPLLSESFRTQVLGDQALSPGGQWLVWSNASAVTRPTITQGPNQGAPDSSTRRYFVFEVAQAGFADGRQVGSTVDRQVWVIAVRGANGWEVSQLQEQ